MAAGARSGGARMAVSLAATGLVATLVTAPVLVVRRRGQQPADGEESHVLRGGTSCVTLRPPRGWSVRPGAADDRAHVESPDRLLRAEVALRSGSMIGTLVRQVGLTPRIRDGRTFAGDKYLSVRLAERVVAVVGTGAGPVHVDAHLPLRSDPSASQRLLADLLGGIRSKRAVSDRGYATRSGFPQA